MHGATFFCFRAGRGGAEENFFRTEQVEAGQGAISSERGGATVKPGAFSGLGGVVLKIFWAGAVRAAVFSGAEAGRASLLKMRPI